MYTGGNMKEYLECGKIANTHGVRGAVLIESYCDSPSVLAGLKCVYTEKGGVYLPIRVLSASVYKGRVMATLEGIATLEDAAACKGTLLYAARADLPLSKGAYFLEDLIGLPVFEITDGRKYGVLKEVIESPASNLYAVEGEHGVSLIPAVPAFIKKIDLETGIYIAAIEGMFP